MRSGSFATNPANRGSVAMTRAAAAASESTALGLGASDGDGAPIDGDGVGVIEGEGAIEELQAAIARTRIARTRTAGGPPRARIGWGPFMAQRRSWHDPGSPGDRRGCRPSEASARVQYGFRRRSPDQRPGRCDPRPGPVDHDPRDGGDSAVRP